MRRENPESQDGHPTIKGLEGRGSSEFQAQNRGQKVQSLGLHLPTENLSEAGA